ATPRGRTQSSACRLQRLIRVIGRRLAARAALGLGLGLGFPIRLVIARGNRRRQRGDVDPRGGGPAIVIAIVILPGLRFSIPIGGRIATRTAWLRGSGSAVL